MNRRRLAPLALALALSGCTADFLVGPQETGSSTSDAPSGPSSSSMTSPSGSTTTDDSSSTTQAATTPNPVSTTSNTDNDTTTSAGDTRGTEDTEPTSTTTTGGPTGETERPQDCVPKKAQACEEAFPTCFWNGEECTLNSCDVGGEKECLAEAPECIWADLGCVPTNCGGETECGSLDPGPCEEARGCVLVGESCFTPPCVPCGEVDNVKLCNELPNCDYSEGRETCQPL